MTPSPRNTLFAVALVFTLSGCVLSPVEVTRYYGDRFKFERQELRGTDYTHVVYFSNNAAPGHMLHVYLEGDGTPWLNRTTIASDPTGRRPLMLKLMALDDKPGVYLGRPCYDGFSSEPGCHPALWTSARYSSYVVDSMAGVLSSVIEQRGITRLNFYGHSGGGALAMLLAAKFPQTRVVVTLGGNLDIAAWTRHHDFSPLTQSINPSLNPPLDRSIHQLHLMGGRDQSVPPELVKGWISKQDNALGCVLEHYTHRCCWDNIWDDVLRFGDAQFKGCLALVLRQ